MSLKEKSTRIIGTTIVAVLGMSMAELNHFWIANGETTQATLADRVGVNRQTIITIEHGRYSPSLEMAFQIARIFNVPLDDVFQYPGTEQ
jgi:putative transcriptional regulator